MPSNNLRVLYKNLADLGSTIITANVTASSVSTPISNAKSDIKSRVYRSTVGSSVNLTVLVKIDLGAASTAVINTTVLAFTNFTSNATIRLYGTNTDPTIAGTIDSPTLTISAGFTSAVTNAVPYVSSGNNYWGSEAYLSTSGDRRGYARIYTNNTTAYRYYVLEIKDTKPSTGQYIEFSRLILGTYWSPKYNTSYGLSRSTKDLSDNSRTEAGDLITNVKPSYDTLSFDLKYMDKADRAELQKILSYNKLQRSIFVSLFPENQDDYGKEQMYQIYGKMSQLFPIEHPLYEMYGSQLDIEEI